MQIPDAVLVEIEVPRDTDASFDPQIVTKRQRRLSGIDEIVLSLSAKGLTTREIAAHFQDVYGATVSKDTISRITDKVLEEMTEWCRRPVYPVVFIDAIHLKVGTGRSPTGRSMSPSAFTAGGERDILGLWVSDGGEGAKFWMGVLARSTGWCNTFGMIMVEVLHGQGWSSGDVGAQKRDAWDRRQQGESVHEIADALGKHADSIYWLMVSHGGFAPSRRHRGRWVLSLPEREEILRGLAQRESARAITVRLGRAPSISPESGRHAGRRTYRAAQADDRAWANARQPKHCVLYRRPALRRMVAAKLAQDWSPQQISGWLVPSLPR